MAHEKDPLAVAGQSLKGFFDLQGEALREMMAGTGAESLAAPGIEAGEMAEWAATHSGYDAVHVLSHGALGQLALGTAVIDANTLTSADAAAQAQQAEWAAVGQALTTDGDLLLYGCSIGAEGMGFKGLMRKFDESRVVLAAGEVGMARAAFEYAVEYATERKAFGAPIHVNQAVSFRLVDVKMKIDQARLLVRHAALLADSGQGFATEAAMAKLAASEAAWFSAWACCQTLGGYSYSREYPAEKWLRDAKLEELWEGTSDIMRLIISRDLFPRI